MTTDKEQRELEEVVTRLRDHAGLLGVPEVFATARQYGVKLPWRAPKKGRRS